MGGWGVTNTILIHDYYGILLLLYITLYIVTASVGLVMSMYFKFLPWDLELPRRDPGSYLDLPRRDPGSCLSGLAPEGSWQLSHGKTAAPQLCCSSYLIPVGGELSKN